MLNLQQLMPPYPDPIDYQHQSIEVPGTKKPGQTAHYRNGIWGLVDHSTPNVLRTCTDLFDSGLHLSRNKPFLGHRPIVSQKPLKFSDTYVWQTYAEVDVRRRSVGSALSHLFETGVLGGGELRSVGIWSLNRPEWQIVDLALQAYQLVGVSLYDTLGRDAVEYIINHAHTTAIFATSQHISSLLKLAPKIPHLRLIVSFDPLSPDAKHALKTWGETYNIRVLELHEIEELGKKHLREPIPAKIDDIASLCYTSGTTSNPKGVVLKHGMLGLSSQVNLYGFPFAERTDQPVLISYLPLAHIYERVLELAFTAIGGRIGFFTGDPLRLLEDAQTLRPHFFPSVPRVLNRVYQSAMAAGETPGIKGKLFKKALATKLEQLKTTGKTTHPLWDRLVFKKIQAVLGGNLMLVSTGSAPISPDVMDFLKISLGCHVIEGYAMTENCATCTHCLPDDNGSTGTVGPPQPVNEIKLVDVPAMGYTSEDKPNPRGELCVRGPNCFSEYYKDEKNTREAVESDGWIHTGDVAEIDSCGRFKIIDRVKNIMKLAQGEYVALEKIENLYSVAPYIAQIYVHGDSLQPYLIAVIVPDPVQLSALASKVFGSKVAPEDTAALEKAVADARISEAVLQAITVEAKKNGLKGFEMIKRIHLSNSLFSVEDGTLTPTFKIKRKDAYNKYKAELDALYDLGEPTASSSKL